jgi:hypothetical protein
MSVFWTVSSKRMLLGCTPWRIVAEQLWANLLRMYIKVTHNSPRKVWIVTANTYPPPRLKPGTILANIRGMIHKENKLRGLSLWANYTNRATVACRRSYC